MKRYGITCTMIFNGYTEVEACDEEEAINIARRMFDEKNTSVSPQMAQEGWVGNVWFDFGEVTADYAEEL